MATISIEARNEALDALLANVDGGKLRIYTGAAPALPTDAATGTLLAEIDLGTPAFNAASGGAALIAASTPEDAAPASGVAGYGRLTKSDNTGVIDMTAGGSLRVVASDSSGDVLFTTTVAHGFSNNDPIRFFPEAGGSLPSNVTEGVTYYVKNTASLTFKIGTSTGGSALAYADAGTPPMRVTPAAAELSLATSDGSVSAGTQVAVAALRFSI
jgi:hypothetical protein